MNNNELDDIEAMKAKRKPVKLSKLQQEKLHKDVKKIIEERRKGREEEVGRNGTSDDGD